MRINLTNKNRDKKTLAVIPGSLFKHKLWVIEMINTFAKYSLYTQYIQSHNLVNSSFECCLSAKSQKTTANVFYWFEEVHLMFPLIGGWGAFYC